mgnify:CR=1 FL=1
MEIPEIEDGIYIIKIMVIGYESIEKEIILSDQNIRLNFEINPQAIDAQEVNVSAERARFENKVDISRVNISRDQIRKAPAFVEADVFRTIQLLPSVSTANDFNAGLIVRGGSADENLIMLDGTQIYNPYHLGGIFSTFNADMIADTEFLAGGFPVEYSNRLSSVLKVTAKEGNSKGGRLSESWWLKKYIDFSGVKGDISLLSSKLLAEGAFYKGSWMLSLRRTYFDQFAKLYNKIAGNPQNWDYYFWDIHLKVQSDINPQNRLIYSQFSGTDDLFLNFGGEATEPELNFNWDWGNRTNSLIWRYIPKKNYFVETNFSRTKYAFDLDFNVDFFVIGSTSDDSDDDDVLDICEDENEVDSDPEEDQGRLGLQLNTDNALIDNTIEQKFHYIPSEQVQVLAGWEYKSLDMDYTERFNGDIYQELYSEPSSFSTYLSYNYKPIPIIHFDVGARLTKYKGYESTLLDPRFRFKYRPTNDISIKFAWGSYSQNLFTTNEENEDNFRSILRVVDFWQPVPQDSIPQRAQHYILGAEYWMPSGNILSLEVYYKPYSSLYDVSPKLVESDPDTYFYKGSGRATGLELLYRINKGKFSGWMGYTLSKMIREFDINGDGTVENNTEIYPSRNSRLHSFNMVLSYDLSAKWELGISTVFNSGQPYTPVVGKVYQQNVDSYGSLDNPYAYFNSVKDPYKNSATYPPYFRLDLSLSKKVNWFKTDGKFKWQ